MDEVAEREVILTRHEKRDGPLNTQCWIWTGAKATNGYPRFDKYIGRRPGGGSLMESRYAHRRSYELFVGNLNNNACHRCDTPLCVNPDHLFDGTDADNHSDKTAKGRQPKGEDHGNSHLTADDVLRIRELAGTISQSQIAEMFGTNQQHVSEIVTRKHWKHI